MKILCFVTHTNNCETMWRSLEAIGHNCTVKQYDNLTDYKAMVDLTAQVKPRAIIYFGAIECRNNRPPPPPDLLKQLNALAPMVHICGDASDDPWWPLLELWDKNQCFSAQVSIDGNITTPIAEFKNGLVKLTPIDYRVYAPKPYNQRSTLVGSTGLGGHGKRLEVLNALQAVGLKRVGGLSWEQMGKFLSDCKLVVNYPGNGSETDDHVKGRVIEAGFAGACLLEQKNKWTLKWFEPGIEYLEYANPEDAVYKVEWARDHPDAAQMIAQRFEQKVWDQHHPVIFWDAVFKVAQANS